MTDIKIVGGKFFVLAAKQRESDEAAIIEVSDSLLESFYTVGPNTGVPGMRVYVGPTDPISDMPVFILSEHHHLHEGEMHQVTYFPAALANGASIDFRFVVGNLIPTSRTPHMTIELDTTGECWMLGTYSHNSLATDAGASNANWQLDESLCYMDCCSGDGSTYGFTATNTMIYGRDYIGSLTNSGGGSVTINVY